jgi:hypothetical protein
MFYKYTRLLSFGNSSDTIFHIVANKEEVAGTEKFHFNVMRVSSVLSPQLPPPPPLFFYPQPVASKYLPLF